MNRRIVRAAVAAAFVLVAGTGCGQQQADFCAANAAASEVFGGISEAIINGEEDEYYPKLVDAYESLIAAAPPEVVPDLTLLADYYRSDRSVYDKSKEDEVDRAVDHLSEVLLAMCS